LERKDTLEALRADILRRVAEYHALAFPSHQFVPGQTPVPVAGRVFDEVEMQYLAEATLDFWLTAGRFASDFERSFARFFGVRHAMLVNSGSSANLLALSCLTSPTLGERRLQPGDEVITVAAGFPTTVNPIVHNRLVPVFVDVTIPSYNLDVSQLEMALSARTKAVMVAHTLGNPFDLDIVTEFVRKHNLWLIEDCCDAVGATFGGRSVGTFGDLSTVSFYPAHHITMGEGGCVLTNRPDLKRLVESFRDWGRDCWCETGQDNACGKRFSWDFGSLPSGYDHKFVYSHIGYNLKLTDMQAAVGLAQIEKLPSFIRKRRANFAQLLAALKPLAEYLILPEEKPDREPSWFGFPITIRESAPFSRATIIRFLEDHRIGTRLLFGGNLVRQPAYRDVKYRVVGNLAQTDRIMRQTFWVGVYPGLGHAQIEYIAQCLRDAVSGSAVVERGS